MMRKLLRVKQPLGLEILEQTNDPIDYVFVPVGGGGYLQDYPHILNKSHQTQKS